MKSNILKYSSFTTILFIIKNKLGNEVKVIIKITREDDFKFESRKIY